MTSAESGAPGSVVLIRSACVMDPSAGLEQVCDLLAVSGVSVEVGPDISPDRAVSLLSANGRPTPRLRVIDAAGLWLWPGLVDVHVHFREPGFTHKETFATGSRAAAAGGYTSVVCEPNTEPPLDSPARMREAAGAAAARACIRVYFKAAMTRGRRGKEPVDVEALAALPDVVAFSDDGDPVVSDTVMALICRAAARADALLSPHCEDSPQALAQVAESNLACGRRQPHANEPCYIRRDLSLAENCGCRIHFSHVSLSESVQAIDEFRHRAGTQQRLSFEVTAHHLLLSSEDFPAGSCPRVNPPLRSSADRAALQDALVRGTVDAIASDHAPHTLEEKKEGASGLIGLETTLGLVLTHVVATRKLSALAAVELLSTGPARIFRLPAGSLQAGAPADMVLIDPRREWTVEPEGFFSKARNCPFSGWKLTGRAVCTFVGGEVVYRDPSVPQTAEAGGANLKHESLR